jgi:hypothetical protein
MINDESQSFESEYNGRVVSWLNADVKERGEEREKRSGL